MFYPHPFGHPIQYPFPPYSTGHYPMPNFQQNQVQSIIVKDIKQENWEDAKNGSYRNCLVCGDNNFACGWLKYSKNIDKINILFWLIFRQIHWNWTSSLLLLQSE
jgi:hypothetical protein